jgi:WD40 repeat protein
MPADILAIEGKLGRSDADKKILDEHYTSNVKLLAAAKFDGAIYAVGYKPDGSFLAAAGEDGRIRLMNPKDAKVVKEFMPVTVSTTANAR